MTATGIVRTVDELGRIVLTKYQPSCVFCGETADVIPFRGKNVCPACRRALALL